MESIIPEDTIAAISTPPGTGGIAVIRISGKNAINIVNKAWKGADLSSASSHSLHLGRYFSLDGNMLDEAVAAVFISPSSFTGEDVVELSVHGSPYIQRELLNDLVRRGVRIAEPGEFTKRAFLNGKLDLAQAEGVADLISSSSKAAHDMAINQTKGNFSREFEVLRDRLIEFASLMELELDFSEEDVEFAQRDKLIKLCNEISEKVSRLAASYSSGSVLKEGVPVVIAGIPNAGKSSLLNLLLNEDKAIVTDIPGTTRDLIEGTSEIDGVLYRFIDTAGLRDTSDVVEEIGVGRALKALDKAYIVIWIIDGISKLGPQMVHLKKFKEDYPDKHIILIRNKVDLGKTIEGNEVNEEFNSCIDFSNVSKEGYRELLQRLHELSTAGQDVEKDIIVTNARHYESLSKASVSLQRVCAALNEGLSGDLVAQDIREAIYHLGSITGSITTDHLLHSIFSRFCIGK